MYIGSTGSKGLHHLVYEVIDNSVDEALAGFCTEITLTLHPDGQVEVQDNGRGIPCEVHPVTGKSTLETVLCVLHAGGKFGGDQSGYKVSGGLHGVGISVVNALSERLVVEVTRDGKTSRMAFSKGLPTSGLDERPSTAADKRGTRVWFLPDPEIFRTTTAFEMEKLAARMDELAYLNAGLVIKLVDGRGSEVSEQVFVHEGGVSELIREMSRGKTNLFPDLDVISFKAEKSEVGVEVAMRWSSDQYDDVVFGFANGIRTSDGGSHLEGLKAAISRTVNQLAKKVGR